MAIETLNITPTIRVTLDYDDNPECPRGWGGVLSSFVPFSTRTAIVDAEGATAVSGDLAESIDDAHWRAHHVYRGDGDVWMRRWFAIFHPEIVAFDYAPESGGYWILGRDGLEAGFKSPEFDYVDAILAGEYPGNGDALTADKILKGEIEVYETWARGEVYGVALERAAEWARVTPGGDLESAETMTTWEVDESLWGIYPESGKTLEAVALATALDMIADDATLDAIRAAAAEKGVEL